MKNLNFIAFLIAVALFLGGCGKNGDPLDPYIILKNASGEVINSTAAIPVSLNGTFVIHAEIGYEQGDGNNLDYAWKIDNGAFTPYAIDDGLNITSLGRENNLSTEKATLTVSFSEAAVSVGSQVTVRINDQTSLSRSVTFEVE